MCRLSLNTCGASVTASLLHQPPSFSKSRHPPCHNDVIPRPRVAPVVEVLLVPKQVLAPLHARWVRAGNMWAGWLKSRGCINPNLSPATCNGTGDLCRRSVDLLFAHSAQELYVDEGLHLQPSPPHLHICLCTWRKRCLQQMRVAAGLQRLLQHGPIQDLVCCFAH